jgi:hypothetical protein
VKFLNSVDELIRVLKEEIKVLWKRLFILKL